MIDDRYIWAVQVTSPRSGGPVTGELLSFQHVRGRPGDAAASCRSVRISRCDPGTGFRRSRPRDSSPRGLPSSGPLTPGPSTARLFRTASARAVRRAPLSRHPLPLESLDGPSVQSAHPPDHRRRRPRHDGHRHRRGPRPGGSRGHRHRHQRGRRPAGRDRPRRGHRALRRPGAAHRAGAGRRARPLPHLHRPGRRRRGRSGHRGRARVVRDQAAGVPRARRDRAARHHPRHRHQRPVGDAHGRRVAASGARAGPALLQPGPGDEAGRDRLLRPDRPAGRRGGHRTGPRARQGARPGRRPARLRRRRPALRLPQPGRGHVRGAVRLPRGHRRGHAARLRAAHGPARAARPDRRGHRPYRPGGHVHLLRRPAARPGPDPGPARRGRPDRAEVRPRLLHVRGAGQLGDRP